MNYNKAVFEAAYGTSKQLPKDENIEFAFSGHSNVGKSSLMNAILAGLRIRKGVPKRQKALGGSCGGLSYE